MWSTTGAEEMVIIIRLNELSVVGLCAFELVL